MVVGKAGDVKHMKRPPGGWGFTDEGILVFVRFTPDGPWKGAKLRGRGDGISQAHEVVVTRQVKGRIRVYPPDALYEVNVWWAFESLRTTAEWARRGGYNVVEVEMTDEEFLGEADTEEGEVE